MSPTATNVAASAAQLQQAINHHQNGELPQAQALYRQILQVDPRQPDALHLLGLIEHQSGRSAEGVALIQRAMQANAAEPMYPFNLGNVLMDLGRFGEAVACYRQAVALQPDSLDALQGLAAALRANGQSSEAARSEQKMIALRGQLASRLLHQGNVFFEQKQYEQAALCFRQMLHLRPDFAEGHFNLATVLQVMGQLDEAVAAYRQAIALKPAYAAAHCNLGRALKRQGKLGDAADSFRRALALDGKLFEAHNNLGNTLFLQGRLDESVRSYRKALALQPGAVDTVIDMATALTNLGQVDEAIALYRRVLATDSPRCAEIHSTLLFTLLLHLGSSAEAVFDEHLRFAQRFEAPLKANWMPHANTREPQRRLKVGYLSGDLCGHAVWYFIAPVMAHHDHKAFEIYAYYNNTYRDGYTDQIAVNVDHWFTCAGLSDDELAARVRADGIDILVDLSGHTTHHRLLTMARKPAPVQATWIGYPGSTGLSAIDYRITDLWQDPPGQAERMHSEKLVWLPGGMAFVSEPLAPAVNDLPALKQGFLTLACLNNLTKVNDAVIALWSRILHALPSARLMLGNVVEGPVKRRIFDVFTRHAVPVERLILQPRVSLLDYLGLHHQIDLALDPFPYNGGTTTMHSLWMGVPVVTLAGDHAVARLSAAHLSRVGLPQFIAHSEEDYIQCVLRAAQDLPALNDIRRDLRQRMTTGACDPALITAQLERAYRSMWCDWCAQSASVV